MVALAIAGPASGVLLTVLAALTPTPARIYDVVQGLVAGLMLTLVMASLTQASSLCAAAGVTTLVLFLVAMAVRGRDGDIDDSDNTDDEGGPKCHRPPRRPPGPQGGIEPPWWPQFERDFAEYCRGRAEPDGAGAHRPPHQPITRRGGARLAPHTGEIRPSRLARTRS